MKPGSSDERPAAAERGSAVVEFIVIGVLVLVPLVYAVQAVMSVSTAMLASGQAAREAARAFSTSSTADEGRRRAVAAARIAFRDQGLVLPDAALRIGCDGGPCLSPGSTVSVLIDWATPLPWIPADWASAASVPVSSEQRVPIDDYRSGAEP